MSFWRRGLCAAAIIITGLAIGACSGQKLSWKTHNISGLMPELSFQLTNPEGQTVTARAFRGKVVMLYFGFTHCQDVCPTTIATSLRAMKRLKDKGRNIRFLFVSVDPKRDTLPVLKKYVASFDSPSLVGLTGTQKQLRALAKRYRVSYSYDKPDADGNYEVNHSAAVFVFDQKGRVHLIMNYKDGPDDMAHDLQQLVNGEAPPVRKLEKETGT